MKINASIPGLFVICRLQNHALKVRGCQSQIWVHTWQGVCGNHMQRLPGPNIAGPFISSLCVYVECGL